MSLKRKLGEASKKSDASDLESLYKQYKYDLNAETDFVCKLAEVAEQNVTPIVAASQVKLPPKPDDQCACMLINLAALRDQSTSRDSELKVPTSFEMTRDIFENTPVKNEALYTAYIRYLTSVGQIDKALEYFIEMMKQFKPHIRTFATFFEQPNLGFKRLEFLIELIRKYELEPPLEMFTSIFKNLPLDASPWVVSMLLEWTSNLYHKVPEELAENVGRYYENTAAGVDIISTSTGKCKMCCQRLAMIDITESERKGMLDVLSKFKVKEITALLMREKYDYIVDGANVALHNNCDFNCNKVDKVLSQLDPSKKVLVVFHICRKKMASSIPKRSNVHYYFSKHNEDDDLTWMYSTLFLNCMCITADKMSDHLYHKFSKVITRNVFEKWVECHIIRYDFIKDSKDWVILYRPKCYSDRIQITARSQIHIPVQHDTKEVWFCVNKKNFAE